MRFVSFFSVGFITAIVVNPAERKLAKRISVQCSEIYTFFCSDRNELGTIFIIRKGIGKAIGRGGKG